MKKILLVLVCLTGLSAHAAGGGGFGFNVGFGFPYLSQGGLNYVHSSNKFSVELGYNLFNISVDDVSVGLSKMEASFRWHPFSGSFYLGVGVGQQTLFSKASQSIATQSIEAKIEIKSNTLTPQIGWMWGVSDGGLFAGLDFGFQSPSGATSTLTTNADATVTSSAEYQALETDVRDQGKKFGEMGFVTMTFLRIGYIF